MFYQTSESNDKFARFIPGFKKQDPADSKIKKKHLSQNTVDHTLQTKINLEKKNVKGMKKTISDSNSIAVFDQILSMIYVEKLQHEVLKAMSYLHHYNDADGNMYYKMQITTKKIEYSSGYIHVDTETIYYEMPPKNLN